MTNNKSGDILSACIAFAVSTTTLVSVEHTQVTRVLLASGAMPEWAIVAILCSILCLFTALTKYDKFQALAKFLSGCVWGSMAMILGAESHLYPLFWIALILFTFDILTVITRSFSWRQRRHS